MSGGQKLIAWLLRLNAIVLMMAFFAIWLPTEWMASIHQALGLGELPRSVITEYLTRSLSALYALHGAVVFVISLDVVRYWPLVRMVAILNALFGVAIVGIDWYAGLPSYWICGEGPGIIGFGLLIWALHHWTTSRLESK